MGLSMNIEAHGLAGVDALLKRLQRLGTAIAAVELHSVPRTDSAVSNAELLDYLDQQGREFARTGPVEADDVAQAFVDELVKRGGLSAASEHGDTARKANELAAASMRSAMKKLMSIVTRHIDDGTGPDGAALSNADLSEEYATRKRDKYGFDKPIGKATGQLLDNVSPKRASGKIKIKRNK